MSLPTKILRTEAKWRNLQHIFEINFLVKKTHNLDEANSTLIFFSSEGSEGILTLENFAMKEAK